MEALLTQGFGQMPAAPEPVKISKTPEARTARSATIFAAIYLALVLGSPLIVRYGPSTDDHAMAALATRMEQPRCASTPQFAQACPGRTVVARDVARAEQPDL
jgi:hypothetical protein